jgi:hypothetical protein
VDTSDDVAPGLVAVTRVGRGWVLLRVGRRGHTRRLYLSPDEQRQLRGHLAACMPGEPAAPRIDIRDGWRAYDSGAKSG